MNTLDERMNGVISKFKRVVVNDEVIAGEDIEQVYCPEPGSIVWRIVLKNGQLYQATGNITLVSI